MRANATVRPTGVCRASLRPVAVALPRPTAAAVAHRNVAAKAQDKSTVAAVALEAAPQTETQTHAVTLLDAATYNDFLQLHADKLVVVDFYTDWCGPCKLVAPEIERMARESDPSKVQYAKLNCGLTNDSKKLAISLGIKALPTFHLYREAKLQTMMTGNKVKALEELICKHLA